MIQIEKIFIAFVIIISGFMGWAVWDTSPTQSTIEDIDSVTIEGDSESRFIKFVKSGEVKQLNIDAIDSIKISNKDFSYYSYFRPYYTLYLVEEDYQRIFKSVNTKVKNDSDSALFK